MDVDEILNRAQNPQLDFDLPVPLEFDLGNLTALNINFLDESQLKNNTEQYLSQISRNATQLLVNQLFTLPRKSTLDGIFATLPSPGSSIPRAKPLPKEKPMTRWERFAKAKGIQKKRKTRAKFDEDTGEWRSTYGSGSKKNDDLSDWILEVPKNADPYEDQYEKKQLEKAEKLSKNKKQQARNEAESAGTIPSRKSNPAVLKAQKKKEVEKQLVVSKSSTASLGKFDKKLKDEKKILTGKRRKFASLTGDSQEKKRAVNIAKKINGE